MESCSQASSNLSHTSSNCDINDIGSDQDHLNSLDNCLLGTSEELQPSNIHNNTSESSDIMDDSEVTVGGITVLEATDDGEGRQEPGVENELSSHLHSNSVRVEGEGGGVPLDGAITSLSNEAVQMESPDDRHQVIEAPLNFSGSRRQETSSHSFLQRAGDLAGSIAQNVRGQDPAVEVQQLDHDFENEGDHDEISAEPGEQIDAADVVDVNQFESVWVQDHYVNDDIEGGHLYELPEDGNRDDYFQEAVQSWLGQPSGRDIVSNGQVSTFYLPDDDNVYNMELQELLSR